MWDRGTWSSEGDAREAYRRGRRTFALHGEKLRGGWQLIRTHGRGDRGGKTKSWLLFKASDAETLRALGALEGRIRFSDQVPIEPRLKWDAKAFSRAVVEQMVRAEPSRYLATVSKAKRSGKVLLDYLRNGRGATAVAAYSTRAKPDAPVSVPIAWDELTPALRADSFRLADVPSRLAALTHDPWASFDADRRPITQAMRRALRLR